METARIAEQFSHGIGGPIALSLIAFSTVFIVLVALTLTIMAIRYLAVVSERKPSKPEDPGRRPLRPRRLRPPRLPLRRLPAPTRTSPPP